MYGQIFLNSNQIPVHIFKILPYTSSHESSWHKEHFEAILQILST